jgi:signal peptidase II
MVSMAELPASSASRDASGGPAASRDAPRSTLPLRLGILLLTLSLFGCDHATKLAAEQSLSNGRAVSVVAGVLELRFTTNDDTAFSLLHNLGVARTPLLLVAASALALLGVVAMWIAARKRATRMQHVGFALVLAGALGNVVDRMLRGAVVDFIHVTHWPIFNVADISVVVGVGLLGLAALLRRPRLEPSPPA